MEGPTQLNRTESNEDFSTKIALYFFRHDKKESSEGKVDEQVRLTEEGRKHAVSAAKDGSVGQSVAFNSPKIRTKETALLHMAGQMFTEEDLADANYKLDRLIEKIGPGKSATDKRLDYMFGDATNALSVGSDKAYAEGTLLKFIVEESDALAKEIGDGSLTPYSKFAAGLAEIVRKYLTIAPRFDELVKEKPENYERIMRRFMGTHQTIAESFLAKIIEKLDGTVVRDAFVKALNNQGFDFSEGFECDILTDKNGKVTLRIKFEKPATEGKEGFIFDREIDVGIIDEIISEGNFILNK
jgi:hypothetical protein